jgi:predicted MFS family arabinose efflux permease
VAPDKDRSFDVAGAVLSAAGMFFVVVAILQIGVNNALVVVFGVLGVALLAWFFLHIRSLERGGREPLLSTAVLRNRTANLAMVTQNVQWFVLMGSSFVISVYLQVVRGYSAIDTGLIFTSATAGVLVSSLAAERLAKRRAQSTLIRAGFLIAIAGIVLGLALVRSTSGVWTFVPGLLLIGVGVGTMLTPSVNVVQSSFSEDLQGEISGLSRSVSNLGSSLGTAIAGTILVSASSAGNHAYAYAMGSLALAGLIGLGAALMLPAQAGRQS